MVGKRLVTPEQLERLLERLLQCRDMTYVNRLHSPQDPRKLNEQWESLAEELNNISNGTRRSSSDWRKYWVDIKSKAKSKATSNKPLSELDARIMSILGPAETHGDDDAFGERSFPLIPVDDALGSVSDQPTLTNLDDTTKNTFRVYADCAKQESEQEEIAEEDPPSADDPVRIPRQKRKSSKKARVRDSSDDSDAVLRRPQHKKRKRMSLPSPPRSELDAGVVAEALKSLARSQADFARAQRALANTIQDMRQDLRQYFRDN